MPIYQDRAIDISAFTIYPRPTLFCADCTYSCVVYSGWEESRERPERRGSYYFAELCHWTSGCNTFKGEYLDLIPLPTPPCRLPPREREAHPTHGLLTIGTSFQHFSIQNKQGSGERKADCIARTPLQPQSKRIPHPPPTPPILNLRHRAPQRSLSTLPIRRPA